MEKRVSLQRVNRYEPEALDLALAAALRPLGGIGAYVKPGQRVLLKVNAVIPSNPKRAVVTHPMVVASVAKAVLMAGGVPVIADSPGGPYQPKLLEATYRANGLWDLAKRLGVELNLDCSSFVLAAPHGRIAHDFPCITPVKEADVIISLGKLKTHGMMMYTGAVKNLFGTVPGMSKAEYHLKMPREEDFAALLVDLAEALQPDLAILDGIVAMEGNGPNSGRPRELQALLVSPNAHALDLAACGIIGLAMDRVPTLKEAYQRGLIPEEPMSLELFGEPLVDLAVNDFELPKHRQGKTLKDEDAKGLKRVFLNSLRPRPVFLRRKCRFCRRCVESCPVKCLKMTDKGPKANLGKCIRCFCCEELCPYQAVSVSKPWLSHVLFRQ